MVADVPRRAIFLLFIVTLGYACFGVIARELARELAVFQQTYLRTIIAFGLATIFFRSWVSILELKKISPRDYAILLLRTFMGYLFGVGFFVLAATTTHLANVSFICALPLTAAWSILLFGERPSAVSVVGLLTSTVGLALVTLQDFTNILSVGRGEVYAFLSALGFSFALVSRRYHRTEIDDRTLSAAFVLVGTGWLLLASFVAGEPLTFHADARLLGVLLFGGALVALISWIQSIAFRNVSGAISGSVLTTEAIFALGIAWALYGELPSAQHVIGGLVIVVGAVLAALGQRRAGPRIPTLSLETECS